MEKQIQYRHIITGMKVVNDTKCHGFKFYISVDDLKEMNFRIPYWVVENSDDWKKIVEPIEDTKPIFSIEDVRKAMRQVTNHTENIIGKQIDVLIHLRQNKQNGI